VEQIKQRLAEGGDVARAALRFNSPLIRLQTAVEQGLGADPLW
jgi:hypothetical protein